MSYDDSSLAEACLHDSQQIMKGESLVRYRLQMFGASFAFRIQTSLI